MTGDPRIRTPDAGRLRPRRAGRPGCASPSRTPSRVRACPRCADAARPSGDRRAAPPLRAGGGSAPAAHRLGRALTHLLGGNVLDVRRHAPPMPEGVLELTRPIAVELVLDRTQLLRACFHRDVEGLVDVLDVHTEGDGRAADLLRADDAHLGELVREHDHGIADLELGVADLAVRRGHAHALGGAEHLDIEVDGLCRAVDREVRADAGIAVGDRLHGRAHVGTPSLRGTYVRRLTTLTPRLQVLSNPVHVRITTSLSAADSAPHTSPGRPRIWRTSPGSLGSGYEVNRSVSGSKRTRALPPKSLSHTLSSSSTYTAYACGFSPG